MAHLHLNELSLIYDMWLNKITYLLTYLPAMNANSHGTANSKARRKTLADKKSLTITRSFRKR